MKLFHISHTDLDGYGCQLLSKTYFKDAFFLNANYGLEVKLSIKKVIEEIKKLTNEDEIFFLITDVNLTPNEAKNLDKEIKLLKDDNYNITLQLLDHHATGQASADKYEWYFLDTKRCATKIVYDYMLKEFSSYDDKSLKKFEALVNAINAIDIWLEDEIFNFEFGKVLLSMVSRAREINATLFSDENRDYRLYLMQEAATFINENNANIKLDDNIHFLKKSYLALNNDENTIDNLSASYLVSLLVNKKEELTVFYNGHKGLLTYTLGGISIPANAFLKANKDYDFFIDVGKKGHTSLRADGIVDVSALACKMADGGGHVNAAGCRFDDFKESIDYNVVKTFVQNKLIKAQ